MAGCLPSRTAQGVQLICEGAEAICSCTLYMSKAEVNSARGAARAPCTLHREHPMLHGDDHVVYLNYNQV